MDMYDSLDEYAVRIRGGNQLVTFTFLQCVTILSKSFDEFADFSSVFVDSIFAQQETCECIRSVSLNLHPSQHPF